MVYFDFLYQNFMVFILLYVNHNKQFTQNKKPYRNLLSYGLWCFD